MHSIETRKITKHPTKTVLNEGQKKKKRKENGNGF